MTLPAYAMNLSSFPEMYERLLVGPLFQPWVSALLQRVKLSAADRVLDLACGTGIVARLAKEQLGAGAYIVGVDLSPQMLAVGRASAPDIDWREGDACALPVDQNEKFDVVICQQGFQFFPDEAAAAREMRRVLTPRGRVAIATWRSLDELPFLQALNRVAERQVGPIDDKRYSFGDAAALEKLLATAGFHDVQLETMSKTIHFADPEVFVRMNATALVGMSSAGGTMSDEERARIVDVIVNESSEVLPQRGDANGLAFEMSTNVATARGE